MISSAQAVGGRSPRIRYETVCGDPQSSLARVRRINSLPLIFRSSSSSGIVSLSGLFDFRAIWFLIKERQSIAESI